MWTEAADTVKVSYDHLLGRWKEEMDTLLVYVSDSLDASAEGEFDRDLQAGVSSAVLTAFNVESYKLLQPDPSDPTLVLLKQISTQLNSFVVSPPFMNSTHAVEPIELAQTPFHAPTSAVWLNTLWFSSLVFSFASATLALFVKQWIYEAIVTGTSRESARLRQYRLNGLRKWHVGTIVVVLPVLLQLSSVLFLSGLLVLLWTLHNTVATVTSVLTVLFLSIFLMATLLPVLISDCACHPPPLSRSIQFLDLHATRVCGCFVVPVRRFTVGPCSQRVGLESGGPGSID